MGYFDGNRVSGPWRVILTFARNEGVDFHLNSGRRTLAEQWKLYRAYQAGGTLAAYPSPTAPHIRVGRPDHALDVQQDGTGGRARLQKFLAARGLTTSLTVPGEDWHIEADSIRALFTVAYRISSLLKHRDRLASRRSKRARHDHGSAAWRRYDRLCEQSLKAIALRKHQLHL